MSARRQDINRSCTHQYEPVSLDIRIVQEQTAQRWRVKVSITVFASACYVNTRLGVQGLKMSANVSVISYLEYRANIRVVHWVGRTAN